MAFIKRRSLFQAVIIIGIIVGIIAIILVTSQQSQNTPQPNGSSQSITDDSREDAGSTNPSGYTDGNSDNRGMSGKSFIRDDGSIDYAAVNNIKKKISGSSIEKNFHNQLSLQLDKEVASGVISNEQRQAIKDAFGME